MKILILVVLFLILACNNIFGQSAEETAKWLNSKKVEILERATEITFNERQIDDNSKQIDQRGNYIFNRDITAFQFSPKLSVQGRWRDNDGLSTNPLRSYTIRSSADPDLLKRFIRALKHLAEVSGAKLADDTLF